MTPCVYRFALYGPANAGKTCLLGALASPHAALPGLACTWRGTPADNPRPAGPEETWVAGDEAVARYRGAEWLRAAVRDLAAGRRPQPNPTAEPLRLRFDFKSDGFDYLVEVSDYSGELLDPDVSADALAVRLRGHLRASDAVFVLAKAPRAGEDGTAVAAELGRLRQAFALLRREADASLDHAAVALIVNQWDRYAADPVALPAFLASDAGAAHRQLGDAIRPRDADDFRAFAASAFGLAASDGRADVPAVRPPLPSVGLEEPFAWAARRAAWKAADAALAAVRAADRRCGPWRMAQPFTGRRRGLQAAAARLRTDYPDDFPHAADAERAVAATRTAWVGQVVCLAVAVGLLWAAGTLAADGRRYAAHRPALAATGDPPVEALQAAHDWLDGRRGRNLAWCPLGRLVLRQADADALLVDLPGRIQRTRERADGDVINRQKLAEWEDRLAAVDPADAVRQLVTLAADSLALPHPEAPPLDLRTRYEDFRGRRDRRLADEQARAGLSAQKRQYYDAVAGNRLEAAAAVLAHFDGPSGARAELVDDFRRRAGDAFRRARVDDAGRRRWEDGRRTLDLRTNAQVRQVLTAGDRAEADRLFADFARDHDRLLYEQLRARPTEQACKDYLSKNTAQPPAMKASAEKYLAHLAADAGPVDVTIHLSAINWGDAWEGKNSVKVKLGGDATAVIDNTVSSTKKEKSSDVGSYTYKARWDDKVELQVEVWYTDTGTFIRNDRDQGQGRSRSLTLRELQKGYELPLSKWGSVAYLKATGGTAPPALPPFLEPK